MDTPTNMTRTFWGLAGYECAGLPQQRPGKKEKIKKRFLTVDDFNIQEVVVFPNPVGRIFSARNAARRQGC